MSGTTICLLRSSDTGAPVLSGQAGVLIALLDACLKDGYNSKTPASITRSGSTATFTYATAHGYAADGLTKIISSGCDQAEYNGIFQISNVATLSFDVTVTGTPATPATTSTVFNTKVAPLGWGKPFSGTNKGVYRGNEVTGTRLYLRVDDTNTSGSYKDACTRGYETMSDVDTGTGPFPTVAQATVGLFISKSTTLDATAKPWLLIGDGYEFFLFLGWPSNYAYYGYDSFHFGDPKSEMTSDPFNCLIIGPTAVSSVYPTSTLATINSSLTTQTGEYMARLYTGIGESKAVGKVGNTAIGGTNIGAAGITYPSPLNNGYYIAPIFINDTTTTIRAQLAGFYQPLHLKPFGHGVLIPANMSPINRRLYTVIIGMSTVPGECAMDIDGPWR